MNRPRKRPWILVLLNVGALASTLYQMHHLVLMLGNH
jgi:hypothetical protein